MIDIHCHILPNVDDGPTSIDEAMRMVDLAYEDGVRCIIATPHRNHVIAFDSTSDIHTSYMQLRALIKDKYPDLGLVLGSELYIRKDYLSVIKDKPYDFSMAGSKFVLIEFQADVSYQEVFDVVHEFKLRGLRPILAHIEVYPNLSSDLDKVKNLREKGAYIQITANSITRKQANASTVFLKKLLRLGLVDFIASDGHHDTVRRPRLSGAYKAVADLMSEKEANRLFVQNPKALMAGNEVAQPTYTVKSGGNKILKLNAVAIAMALVLVTTTALVAVRNRDEALSKEFKEAKLRSEIIETYDLDETTEAATEVTSTLNMGQLIRIEGEAEKSKADKVGQGKVTEASNGENVTQASIEDGYYEALTILKEEYVIALDEIVANIKVANAAISDEVQKQAIIEGYTNEILVLEQNSDQTVNALLYKMQNELESYKFDTSEVQVMRDGYYQIKLDKQNEYLEDLGYNE